MRRDSKVERREVLAFVGNRAAEKNSDRPIREHIINNDDMVNLVIALNTAKSLDEFVSKV